MRDPARAAAQSDPCHNVWFSRKWTGPPPQDRPRYPGAARRFRKISSQRIASYHRRGRRGKSRRGGRSRRPGARAARRTPKRDRIAERFPQGRGARARDPGGAGMSAQAARRWTSPVACLQGRVALITLTTATRDRLVKSLALLSSPVDKKSFRSWPKAVRHERLFVQRRAHRSQAAVTGERV